MLQFFLSIFSKIYFPNYPKVFLLWLNPVYFPGYQQVDERFDIYCNQLEQVISSFEEVAGEGSSKLYTGLALQAMTRHFGSLQEAILSQLNSLRRRFIISQDFVPKIVTSGLSQLSLFDGNTPSSLQRLGWVQGPQRHAWKPIRGLPETSVAILRAWLFHHFLHPLSVFLLLKLG